LSSEHTQPDDLANLDDMDGTESTASFEGRILSKQGDGPVVLECRRGRREGSRDDDNAMTGRSWKGGKVLLTHPTIIAQLAVVEPKKPC